MITCSQVIIIVRSWSPVIRSWSPVARSWSPEATSRSFVVRSWSPGIRSPPVVRSSSPVIRSSSHVLRSWSPVVQCPLVCMRLQHEECNEIVDDAFDVTWRHSPQPGIHGQHFPAGHLVNQGIKLWAVAHVSLHLKSTQHMLQALVTGSIRLRQMPCPCWPAHAKSMEPMVKRQTLISQNRRKQPNQFSQYVQRQKWMEMDNSEHIR